jgi:hypothetical protein
VHEWQEEELALVRRQVLIVAALERAVRRGARERIGGETFRLAAKHVAGKLIEQDDEREGILGGRLPGKLAGDRGLVGRQEPGADLGVERLVLGEPAVRAGLAPER